MRGENNLNKYKLYLEKVQGIAFQAGLAEWGMIDSFRKARNFIVHNDGAVDDSKNGIVVSNLAKAHSDFLELDDLGRITVKKAGNEEFIRCARVVLLDIVAKIP